MCADAGTSRRKISKLLFVAMLRIYTVALADIAFMYLLSEQARCLLS